MATQRLLRFTIFAIFDGFLLNLINGSIIITTLQRHFVYISKCIIYHLTPCIYHISLKTHKSNGTVTFLCTPFHFFDHVQLLPTRNNSNTELFVLASKETKLFLYMEDLKSENIERLTDWSCDTSLSRKKWWVRCNFQKQKILRLFRKERQQNQALEN